MHEIKASLPREAISELAPGTNLLIAGPTMSGKRQLTLELLADGHEEGDGMLFIMTSESAAVLIEDLDRWYPTLDRERIGIIDCAGVENGNTEDVSLESLSSPRDLTGISIATARRLQQFSDHGISTVRHGLISVSTLLAYLDLDTVFKFLHIYTRRITDTRGLGIFTINPTAHDPQTINTLINEFDGIIELRHADTGEREAHLRGLTDATDTWYQFAEGR